MLKGVPRDFQYNNNNNNNNNKFKYKKLGINKLSYKISEGNGDLMKYLLR